MVIYYATISSTKPLQILHFLPTVRALWGLLVSESVQMFFFYNCVGDQFEIKLFSFKIKNRS